MSQDAQLIGAYVAEGSETAFRTLVTRHAGLVYSTALRQLGDSGVAEEITQNVFIALARKAPRLAGTSTLAGWLHRTTILESKTRIRSELRRRTREETAGALAAMEREKNDSLEQLLPLVDEALLQLRETDRIALMLRFCENQSLREVGRALGVDEDAARKRVSRALERVTEFFRQRGFSLPAGAGCAALLTESAQAVPAGLVALSANSALAGAKTVTGLPLLLFYFMNLGTNKLLIGCVLLAAVPLFWQEHLQARLDREQTALAGRISVAEQELHDLETQRQRTSDSVVLLESEMQAAQLRLATLNAQRTGKISPPIYQWDDRSPYMRIPKELLHELPLSVRTENQKVELSEVAKDFLQMTASEAEQVQSAIQEFFDGYEEALIQKARRVEPNGEELRNNRAEDLRVFEVTDMNEEVDQLRAICFSKLESVLGPERFPFFRQTLWEWMPLDHQDRGLHSSMEIRPFPHRRVFSKPKPGEESLISRVTTKRGRGIMYGTIQLNCIPRAYAAHLQDWFALTQNPAEDSVKDN